MDRTARLAALRRILESSRIGSQEQLLQELEGCGFKVTQATLSRDLKYLKVGKVPDGSGGYLYAFSTSSYKGGSDRSLVEDFKRGFVSLDFTANLGVIKTLPGHASSVASALDNLAIAEILGTVAGDDTILVLPVDGASRDQVAQALARKIPGL